jgi:hypothetical protein
VALVEATGAQPGKRDPHKKSAEKIQNDPLPVIPFNRRGLDYL